LLAGAREGRRKVDDDTDAFPLNPTETSDSDADGMGDNFETDNGFDNQDPSDADEDADSDGFSNLREFNASTDPHDPNSKPDIPGTPWFPLLLDN